MFGSFKRALGYVTATEDRGYITIEGIPNNVIQNDIQKLWRTSRVGKHMFTRNTRNSITFASFFAIEVKYMLTQILASDITLTSRMAINRIFKALDETTWLGKVGTDLIRGFNYDRLNEINTKLLPHQLEFIQKYEINTMQYGLQGYYLAADPGMGKTLNGLALGLVMEADVTVIFCPKNAVEEVWVDNIERFFKKQPKIWHSLMGTEPPKDAKYYICHYDQMGMLDKLFARFRPDQHVFIDIDEGHNFNDIKSNRTQRLLNLVKQVPKVDVLWASGTPLKSIGAEVIPFFTTIDPLFKPHVAERFKKIFGMSKGVAGNIISHRLGEVTYRAEKAKFNERRPIVEEITIKIPNGNDYTLETIRAEMAKFIEERVKYYKENFNDYESTYNRCIAQFEKTIPSDDRQYAKYKAAVRTLRKLNDYRDVPELLEFSNWYEKEIIIPTLTNEDKKLFRAAKSVVKYVELKIRGEALGRVLGKKRAQCHVDMVPYARLLDIIEDSASKTLIFTSFTEVVEETEEFLRSQKVPCLMVYGKTNHNLKAIVNEFASDDKIPALAATLQSLSTAVPMIMASSVVFMNNPFRIHEREQAIARADRIGQQHQVRVYDIVLDTGGEPNVSTRSTEIMEWSKQQVDILMGKTGLESVTEAYTDSMEILSRHQVSTEGLIENILGIPLSWLGLNDVEPEDEDYYS